MYPPKLQKIMSLLLELSIEELEALLIEVYDRYDKAIESTEVEG